jgi:hypothetical protein
MPLMILKFGFLSARSKYLFFKIPAQKQENQGFQSIVNFSKRIPGIPGKSAHPVYRVILKKYFPKTGKI